MQAPTFREIRALPQAATPAVNDKPATWGVRQGLLATGSILVVVAVVAALLLVVLRPASPFEGVTREGMEKYVHGLSPAQSYQFFHKHIEPGLQMEKSWKEKVYVSQLGQIKIGLAVSCAVGALGVLLLGLGIAGVGKLRA